MNTADVSHASSPYSRVTNVLFREIGRELLPLAQERTLVVIPFIALAGSLLVGKYRAQVPEKGRSSADVVAWVLANPAITSVILGACRPDQVSGLARGRRLPTRR